MNGGGKNILDSFDVTLMDTLEILDFVDGK